MKNLVLVLLVLGMALPAVAAVGTAIYANDDITSRNNGTNYDEYVVNATTFFGLFVKYPGNESYIEFTLGNTAASSAIFQVYEADTNVTGWWQVEATAGEYAFDENTFAGYHVDNSGWDALGDFTVYAASAQGYYTLDVTDWYNANLGKTMTINLACDTWDTANQNSGPIFEDREEMWSTGTGGPQLLIVEVPEPATLLVLSAGALMALRRKR